LPFSKQSKPADELDIVEIVMAVEDELDISIEDKALNAQAGVSNFKDAQRKLTVKDLQQVAAVLYRARNAASAKKFQR
jgi:acyl carrier protein